MKLYMAAGQYVGTQADARKLDKEFVEVEVPTDKPGLMAFLNDLRLELTLAAPTFVADPDSKIVVEPKASYTEQSVGGDDWFASVAVEHQLTLTQLALENARNEIGRLKGLERGGIVAPEYDIVSEEETDPFA